MEFDSKGIADLTAPVQQNIVDLADTIKQTATTVNPLNSLPDDFKPKSNYYFGQNIAAPVKGALEVKNYNVEDAYAPLNDGTYVAKFDTYKSGRDNNEYFAQNQTTTDKWLNGIGKFGGKTFNAVVGGTAGIVYGVGKMAEDGSLTSLYDNDFSRTLDDWNTKLDYQLPNYYTKQETEKGLFGQAATANFWSDKVLGGLSFTAGAIISEGLWAYATGGTSLGTSFARWGSKSLGALKVAKGINTYKGLLKEPLLAAYRTETLAKNTAIALGRTGDLLNTLRFATTSAGYEASVEALQYKKEATEDFYNNFGNLNGREPNEEDIQKFNSDLEGSANAVFGLNMAIVGSSNLVTLGHIFNLKNPVNTGVADFIEKKAFGRGVEETVVNGEKVFGAIKATRPQKIARTIFDYGKSPISEGIYEEGGQGVVSKTAKKWIENSYNPQLATENADMAGLVYESLAEQYGTKEGWVENGVGLIIGALGGTAGARSESQSKQATIDYKVAGQNTFQSKVIGERFLALNRINGFSQEAEQEAQKGNIVKSRIATDGVLHSRLNHAYQLGEDLNEVVREARTALNTMTPAQFKDAGVAEEDIQSFKDEVTGEYQSVAKQFRTNRKYSEYILGAGDIVGANQIQGEEALGTGNKESLVQALTWTLTAGENASKLMRDLKSTITAEVGNEQSRVISVVTQLNRQQANRKGQITKTVNKRKALISERDRLQNALIEVQNSPNETEGDRTQGRELGQLNIRLLDLENQLSDLDTQLTDFAQELNTQKKYGEGLSGVALEQVQDFDNIGIQDLTDLDANLEKFKKLVDSYSTVNPQRHRYLTDLLNEYTQAEEIFNENQQTALGISSGKIGVKNMNTWLGKKLAKNQSMDEITKEWLTDILTNYTKNKVSALADTLEQETVSEADYAEFKDNNNVSDELLNSIVGKTRRQEELSPREQEIYESRQEEIENIIRETPVAKVETQPTVKQITPLEQLKERLENLLSKNYNSLTYIGTNYDELYLKKPTKAEIDEYRELSKENPSERLDFLTDKLGQWRLLDSAVGDENQSIADLIDLINQLDTEIEANDVKDELTEEDVASVVQTNKDGVGSGVVRYDLAQNTLGSTTVQFLKDKGIYKFSHLKMSSVLNSLNIPYTSERIKVVKDGKTLKKVTEPTFNDYSAGTIFHLDNTKITVGAGNTLEIKEADFITLRDELNLHIVAPTINWSYFDVYETVGDTAQKRPSDFQENINPQLIYEIKPQEELGLQIALDDEYNDRLRNRVLNEEPSEALEKEVEKSLKIYVTKNGQPISTLKATTNVIANDNFMLLRQTAKDAFMANPLSPQFKATVQAQKIFMGSPQLSTQNLTPVNIAMTETAAQNVISTGYSQNGEIKLSREVGEVDRTYLSGIKDNGKKLPVIVIKKGSYNVAYPVKLIKSPSPAAESIIAIRDNTTLSETEKVKQINQRIIDTKIAADKRLTKYDENQIQEIIDDFSQNQTFVSMDSFSNSNYKLSNLTTDVLINIDLDNLDKVISDPKLELDLNSIQLNQQREDKYSSLSQVEDRLSQLAVELDRDFTENAAIKYVDNRGVIVENTTYTDVLDEGTIIEPQSHLQKIANVNALRKAFSEKLPLVVRKALSPETIQEIEHLLKKQEFINSQTNPKREQADKSIKENSCK